MANKNLTGFGDSSTSASPSLRMTHTDKYLNTNSICVPWVNFKTTRDATVMVLKTTNNHKTWFTNYGYTEEVDYDGYFHMVRDSNQVNKSFYKYSKNVEAGELVSVPNDWESSNSYTIIIKYADYE